MGTGFLSLFAVTAPEDAASVIRESHGAADALIPSHDIAMTILKLIDRMLDWLGLEHEQRIEEIVYTAIIFGISLVIGLAVRWVVVFAIRKFMAHRHSVAVGQLLKMRTVSKCTHFIPPLVFFALIPFAFETDYHTLDWIMRFVGVYTLITIGIAICAVLEYAWWRFNNSQNKSNHPLKGILNVCRGVVWIIIAIVSVSILIDKSPDALLAGLGAFAAALMLIFKDSILGFVAGIQLSTNDMLRVGDWIVVPSTIANGVVIDVTLTVVKVQNWDNTIVMLPPYTLVSTSFQNWRGMSDSGARLVNRDIVFAQASIQRATPQTVERLVAAYPVMEKFVRKLQEQKGGARIYNDWQQPNGTIDTNLGLFRIYVTSYLLQHPCVSRDKPTDYIIVALDPAREDGQPLNIEFFTNNTDWAPYEAILSDIFENFAVTARDFGLVISNAPDGNRFVIRQEPAQVPS